jgi:urea transporter
MGAMASCYFPLLDKWKGIVDNNKVAGFIDAVLCAYSQIIFNDNSFSGIILIIATFCISPQVGVGGLICAVTAVIYLKLLKADPVMVRLGVYGFCPTLSGIIISSLIFDQGIDLYFVVFFVLAAIFCVTVDMALAAVFGKWDASGLGLPFGFTTLVFMSAAQNMARVSQPESIMAHMSPAVEPGTVEPMTANEMLQSLIAGISELFGGVTILPAILIGIALLCGSRIDFISSILGAAVSTFAAIFFGIPVAPIVLGLYGYSGMLLMLVLTRAFRITPATYILFLIFAALSSVLASWLTVSMGLIGAVAGPIPFSLMCCAVMLAAPKIGSMEYNAPRYWGVPETIPAIKKAMLEQEQ